MEMIFNWLSENTELSMCIATISATIAAIASLWVAIIANKREKRTAYAAILDPVEDLNSQPVQLIIYNNGNGCARNVEFLSEEVQIVGKGNKGTIPLICPKQKCVLEIEEYSAQYCFTIRWNDGYKRRNKMNYYGGPFSLDNCWEKILYQIKKRMPRKREKVND